MALPDLAFTSIGRQAEIDAIEGGEQQGVVPVMSSADDDGEETDEAISDALSSAVAEEEDQSQLRVYVEHARAAFRDRCLTYPFKLNEGGDGLSIVPGHHDLAVAAACLSELVGRGHPDSKAFEVRAFQALVHHLGGWGVCVGHPRRSGRGPVADIDSFRQSLRDNERGLHIPTRASSGDARADGFVLLGRLIGGPLMFFQAKNGVWDKRSGPDELLQVDSICEDWFGRAVTQERITISVWATNSVITLSDKANITRGCLRTPYLLVDAVDILAAEFPCAQHETVASGCSIM